MVSFNTVNVGDILWDSHRYQMGNTTLRATGNWRVVVIEVDAKRRRALVSWNGNPPRWYNERDIARLRRSPKKEE